MAKDKKGTCQPCTGYTYQPAFNHQKTACQNHPKCDAGQSLGGGSSKESRGSCQECSANHYQELKNFQGSDCTAQPTCVPGEEELVGGSLTTKGVCSKCFKIAIRSYYDKKTDKCVQQPQCPKGQRLTGLSPNSPEKCIACGTYEYQDKANFQKDICQKQPKCRKGEYLKGGDSKAAVGTCESCPEGQFQPLDDFQGQQCTEQKKCPPGERINHVDKDKHASCIECGQLEFIAADGHRTLKCEKQRECTKGQKLSGDSKTKAETCISCDDLHYMDEEEHQRLSCFEHTFCTKGQHLSGASKIKAESCTDCGVLTYVDKVSHQLLQCAKQPDCFQGEYLNSGLTTEKAKCIDCPELTYTDGENQLLVCTPQTTCGRGTKLSSIETNQKGECLACDPNKKRGKGFQREYMDQDNHHLKVCLSQSDCEPGQKMVGITAAAQATCAACDPVTYRETDGQFDACLPQPTCGPGQRLFADIPTQLQLCVACDKGQYQTKQSHQELKCIPKPVCKQGQKVSTMDLNVTGECVPCTELTFQPAKKHSSDTCTPQPNCTKGEYLKEPTFVEQATCTACPDDQYQEAGSHRDLKCKEWSAHRCGKGQKVSQHNAKKAPECDECKLDLGKQPEAKRQYMDQDDHKERKCKEQPTCGKGERISAHNTTSRQICIECGAFEFVELAEHFSDECKPQPKCKQNETYHSPNGASAMAKCLGCNGPDLLLTDHPNHDSTKLTPEDYPDMYTLEEDHRAANACIEVPQPSTASPAGAIAGTVVVVLILVIGGVIGFLVYRKKQKGESSLATVQQPANRVHGKRPMAENSNFTIDFRHGNGGLFQETDMGTASTGPAYEQMDAGGASSNALYDEVNTFGVGRATSSTTAGPQYAEISEADALSRATAAGGASYEIPSTTREFTHRSTHCLRCSPLSTQNQLAVKGSPREPALLPAYKHVCFHALHLLSSDTHASDLLECTTIPPRCLVMLVYQLHARSRTRTEKQLYDERREILAHTDPAYDVLENPARPQASTDYAIVEQQLLYTDEQRLQLSRGAGVDRNESEL